MVTGANPTLHTFPEFLTGRPIQSRQNFQPLASEFTSPPNIDPHIQKVTSPNTSADPINRLAEVLVGMNNKSSAQILMIRPISTTTLTFDGNSEKFDLFEDLFHTVIKM